jgi:hypothetical protein
MAKLTPPENRDRQAPRAAAAAIRRLRKGATLGKLAIREFIDEGRRR